MMNDIKILYINLDSRKDRREHMERVLKGYNYERVSAIEHEDGYIGCAKSHIKCIEIARIRKYDKVIILEDDFMFSKDNNFNNIKLPKTFDIFLLCNRIKNYKSIIAPYDSSHVVKQIKDKSKLSKIQLKKGQSLLFQCHYTDFIIVYNASWMSGHILNHTIYNDLIKNLNEGIESRMKKRTDYNKLDIYWNKLFNDYQCLSHNFIFATQKESYSDIMKNNIKYHLKQNIESKFT